MKKKIIGSLFVFVGSLSFGAALHVSTTGNHTPPFSDWTTAATNIQSAVDAASPGDTVLVADGIYDTGTTVTPGYASMNRVVITNNITVQSVNGPDYTFIVGEGPMGSTAVRGVYMSAGTLSGFTLTNGHTRTLGHYDYDRNGGGVNMVGGNGIVSNCVLTGNSAIYSGGGSYRGTLNNCTLTGNSTSRYGGGSSYGTLNNCTLTGNSTSRYGGGSSYGTLNNCTLTGNSASDNGGGSYYGTLNNCMLSDNSTSNCGGGSYNGTLTSCTLSGNSASDGGGGSYKGTLTSCTLSSNSSDSYGGGNYYGTLKNCMLTGNSANSGGGSYRSTLTSCTLSGNSAKRSGGGSSSSTLTSCTLSGNSAEYGGGSYNGTLKNCTLTGNSAKRNGGGSSFSTLTSCTLTGNSAEYGGGSYNGMLKTCIVYFNTASRSNNNWYDSTPDFTHCCTTPDPGGIDNITDDPMLVSSSHIHADSPCVGAGLAYASGTDIDGEAWAAPPSIGCDEPLSPFSGGLSVSVTAAYTNVVVGHELAFSAEITGETASNRWTFSDGASLSNAVYGVCHAWSVPGSYKVVLLAYNDDHPGGVSATVQVNVVANSNYYVDADNASPAAPYASWATAATNIQDAVDKTTTKTRGSTVWVTNGIYNAGGAATPGHACMNRVVITTDIVVRSVNGPNHTFIVGEGPMGSTAVRGVYMSAGTLSGFTLTNGHTRTSSVYNDDYDCSGGGINMVGGDGVVSNCVLTGNSASYHGGGSYEGTLNNCTLTGNSASDDGGGSYNSMLNNCMLVDNSTNHDGGGSSYGTLNNCTLTGNSASSFSGGGSSYGTLTSCTLTGNSAKRDGGGSYNGTLTNCMLTGNSASLGGGSHNGTLTNCTLSGNSAYLGGGSCSGTLNDCILSGNSADSGGGSYNGILNNCTLTNNLANNRGGGSKGGTLDNCTLIDNSSSGGGGSNGGTLNNCTLSGNSSDSYGGGSDDGTLNNCTLTGNSARYGGGSNYGTLNNCTLSNNLAAATGGGSRYGTLNNCVLTGNSAPHGGGSYYSTLNNCTLMANSASLGGGSYNGTLNNCIVYFNTATSSGDNWYDSTPGFTHCCTTPDPGGAGNMTNDPQFVDASGGNYRLSGGSLCIDAGTNTAVYTSIDLDGNPRIIDGTVDMGAYEYVSSPGDTDGDGLPDEWETQYYGGATNANPVATCSNGINTVMEAYIAGFDPTDLDAGFAVGRVEQIPEGFVVNWNSVTGRVYSVLWSIAPADTYTVLESGIDPPQNSYTDTVHNAENTGFYKVDVKIE